MVRQIAPYLSKYKYLVKVVYWLGVSVVVSDFVHSKTIMWLSGWVKCRAEISYIKLVFKTLIWERVVLIGLFCQIFCLCLCNEACKFDTLQNCSKMISLSKKLG